MNKHPNQNNGQNNILNVEEVDQKVTGLNKRIENLEEELKHSKQKFRLFGLIVAVVGTLVGFGILTVSDITNHIAKYLYTPKFIYEELSGDEDLELDVNEIAKKDRNIHDDILEIMTNKWGFDHYRDFVAKRDLSGNDISYLYTALKLEHSTRLNRLLTERPDTLANPNIFNRNYGGTTINAKIELLGTYNSPDKCGGPDIQKTDRVIIFVKSKSPSEKEEAFDCPGTVRPRIFVNLVTPSTLAGPFEVVGINKSKESDMPIIKVTEKVADELGFKKPIQPFAINGSLVIDRGDPL